MTSCRPETVAFTATAPLRVTATREIIAGPDRIFAALADASSWPRWFPGLDQARWTSPEPHGMGSTREVKVGPLRVVEEFIAWEPGVRFGFTFESTNLPGTRAGVELVELLPVTAHRTRVSYTMALEPVGLPARLAPPLKPVMRAAIGRGLAGLDRYLAQGA
ncbi:MAG: SRPBCC family protein [Nitriliruptor sp.]|uniref:SRPBCC family protein n=1 Tax=Nitriliruptor sp. TaxID=2448056 RepID=UPI00349FF885